LISYFHITNIKYYLCLKLKLMMEILNNNDSICALATPAGGAIAVIRVSGNDAVAITDAVFCAANGKPLAQAKPGTLHYGEMKNAKGEVIDDVMVSVYRAPHSYTGEDSTEISCHGSRYIIQKIIESLISNGCRQALPGEYTQRAYLAGKMDLSQAEAVADLIAATNRASHQLAINQLRGNFSNELSSLREQLLQITTLLELELDFSDQDVDFADREELKELGVRIEQRINSLMRSFKAGQAIKNGVPVAIIGKTNVGKSTLLNKLLNEDRAIVSDIHGTTRDIIEDTMDINGITFRFIDTAGIRQTSDEIEMMGIERTYKKIDEATVVLWLFDEQPSKEEIKDMTDRTSGKKLIIVHNKMDKSEPLSLSSLDVPVIDISAKFGNNINDLKQMIYAAAEIPDITENDVVVTNARHYDALLRAHQSILRVIQGLKDQLSGDLLAEDLRDCLHALSDIVGGEVTSDEVLHNVFRHFCIGK
jgi:tRNA modification GTPase